MKQPLHRLRVDAAAKINIGWRVGERRADGCHEVGGLIQTISLTDSFEITAGRNTDGVIVDLDGSTITLTVPGHPELEDESNLVVAAARALAARAAAPSDASVVIRKGVPVAAGLGGGSADAAAALVGLNAMWRAGLRPRELAELAGALGSDVPAILVGGLVHASGRGEIVRRVGSFTAGWVVLGVGAEPLATKDVYAAFDEIGRSTGDESGFTNDLERAACSLVHGLAERIDAMRSAAGIAFLAGSGPTVVGVVADEARARDVVARTRDHFADVVVARPVDRGVRLTLD